MKRNQFRAEQVIAGGNALGDGNVDFALFINKTGYAPYTAGVETIFVDLEPCFSPEVRICQIEEEATAGSYI